MNEVLFEVGLQTAILLKAVVAAGVVGAPALPPSYLKVREFATLVTCGRWTFSRRWYALSQLPLTLKLLL